MADLFETAQKNVSFKTLITLIENAGLLEMLKTAGPYTVFAPTDQAFAKISANTIASLMEDIPKLKKIIAYHIAFGDVRAEDLMENDEVRTVEGSVLAVDTSDGIKINQANVIETDILSDNGVIHVIDAVLMPALVSV